MKKVLLTLIVLASTTALMAADSSSGCGIGYQVLPKNSLVPSFGRALINATFSNTIAMTLGTSGCARHSIVKSDKQAVHYAEANIAQLTIELARGEGEFVASFSEVLGCQNAQAFGKMMQQNYASILPSENTTGVELYNNVKAQIKNNASLAQSCSLI